MRDRTIRLPDGRTLGYAEFGSPAGFPCLYFHGWPGSRLEAGLFHESAREQGLRGIAVDRPGMGQSEFQRDRRLVDWAEDVHLVASELGVSEFAVIAYSAGFPYALACASRLPHRVVSVTSIAGLGPMDQAKVRRSLPPWMRVACWIGRGPQWLGVPLFGLFARVVCSGANRLFPHRLLRRLPRSDQVALGRPEVRDRFRASVTEAFRSGPRGVAWDSALLVRPWGFSLDAVSCPVLLWHGEADREVPVAMARAVAARLPGVQTRFLPDEGHFSLPVVHQRTILREILPR